MINSTRLVAVTLATLATLVGPTAARAQVNEVPSVVVSYADLDMNSDAGRTQLHRRLVGAARDACGVGGSAITSLQDKMQAARCYKQSLARAEAALANRTPVIASR